MYSVFESLVKSRGITVKKVSNDTGIPYSSLTDWKAGRSTPKIDKITKLANYFNVSVEYLLSGKDTEKESVEGKKYYFNDETAEAAQAMFENEELRVLFSAARDAEPKDLNILYDMLLALKRKEKGDD